MSFKVQFNRDAVGWERSLGSLTLHVPVPLLRGSGCVELCPVDITDCTDDGGMIRGTCGEYQLLAAKARLSGDVAGQSERLYQWLLNEARDTTLLRIWNFVPEINVGHGAQERYQQFCTGRARGFAVLKQYPQCYPAASAVGCEGDELLVYALAAIQANPVHFENPLQVPAYEYPEDYGPDAPTFSRATACGDNRESLLISGTAAVRGHQTASPYDLEAQLRVTAENLRAILHEIDASHEKSGAFWTCAYVRQVEDAVRVEDWLLSEGFAEPGKYTILQSDICRRELMVEVELTRLKACASRSPYVWTQPSITASK